MIEMTSKNVKEIKIDNKDKIDGFYTLLTNGSVVCLPDNEYIVPEEVLMELQTRGIKYSLKE